MGVIPTDPARGAANRRGGPQTFWQRIARLLDRLVVDRSYRMVPAAALSRSRYELNRCRRTLHDASPALVAVDGAPSRRAVRAVQTRP
jgi:hypothetical protein